MRRCDAARCALALALAACALRAGAARAGGADGAGTVQAAAPPALLCRASAPAQCVPLLYATAQGGGAAAQRRWAECGCAAAAAACAARGDDCVVRGCTDARPRAHCAAALCRMAGGDAAACAAEGAQHAPSPAAQPHRAGPAARAQLPLRRRAALDAAWPATAAPGGLGAWLAGALAAKDALLPLGWRLPGPPWCCGACCGDVACFPCYALPYDYVNERVAFLAAAAAGAVAQPTWQPAAALPLATAVGAPLQLPALGAGLGSALPLPLPGARAAAAAGDEAQQLLERSGAADEAARASFQAFLPADGSATQLADVSAAAALLGAAGR